MKTYKYIILLSLLALCSFSSAADFTMVSQNKKASILYSQSSQSIDSIIANLLAQDIQRITGYLPLVTTDISKVSGNVIMIGDINSKLIQRMTGQNDTEYLKLNGKWESFMIRVVDKPNAKIDHALLIAGSDRRGTAYGVFYISEKIGVSPWYWWADVQPVRKKELVIQQNDYISSPPSIKYRGIFLNDEDWGLQPWAAKTYEPTTGDIGPKTYAKIFELLLRLRANLIWPAMHPSTKAFYHYPENKKVADDYAIIIGSSHAEPMLRNNVDEWDVKTMGAFNYLANKPGVDQYWEDRVKESSKNEAIYTLGMRGVHDSGIEGVKTIAETVPLLERIIASQREMLKVYINKNATTIPQVFTAYKEVLDVYDGGLKLPDDVTLVWPDDNYGYILRLNNQIEEKRAGGSGIYYHASYWGRPHDYLWLSSTHPALIREEMMKAYELKSDRLWVLNVGDIKPLEYNIQLFMDMAYQAEPFKKSKQVKTHLLNWSTKIFGAKNAKVISDVMWEYYQLAFERRPEFMGWSQTEPTTKINFTAYNHIYFGDEAQIRIDRYNRLESTVINLRKQIAKEEADAFYELVYYPVMGASLMNKKFLYRDMSDCYAKQNRASAVDYADLSKQAFDSIASETQYFNNQLAGGKWKYMMSMTPRNLPVYQKPDFQKLNIDSTGHFDVIPEGYASTDSSLLINDNKNLTIPTFNPYTNRKYFIDIFLKSNTPLSWRCSVTDPWIKVSQQKGVLEGIKGKKQTRIWVRVDWEKAPLKERSTGNITFTGDGKKVSVTINAIHPNNAELNNDKWFIEDNGYISIFASNYSRNTRQQNKEWKLTENIGHTGKSLTAMPLNINQPSTPKTTALIKDSLPCVTYDFYSFTATAPEVTVVALPTHALNRNYSMRFGISIDDGPIKVMDFETVGRSETWKQNVLRNNAQTNIKVQFIEKGKHALKLYMVDPGVILDRIIINLGGLHKAYGIIPETRIITHK